jgi:hypothetical protein
LLFDYGIQAYQGCEGTMATLKLLLYEALSQMLLTNQHLDKLAAAQASFAEHGMLHGTCLLGVWDQILQMYSNSQKCLNVWYFLIV